ncbi:putative histone-lysine N-methyltransferase lin-59 [Toxocara canis]|uniref:Putative histone-lysine N-methyltransferase lin-59 n=1 Tax=Toxocara canis TaxID=6265 RepID=A0A0B2V9Z6_TOXCA|nr:putative histone-lysine N-methyltransferase lin-59 [Toxocara canis]
MSFEAVPCMFRSTANDGNSSSYIGLLIRPSGSATTPQGTGTTVNAAVVGGVTPNGPKSLHVVPSALKAAASGQAQKVVVPAGVQLRLQPAAVCAAPQCNDGWIHTAARPAVNTTFDSPSPSQVVPQMNVGDSCECSVPCASSSSFFPPISSITQSLSSAKSDIDLLQEICSVEMNVMRNQKVSAASSDYMQSTTPQRHRTNSLQNIYSAPSQTEVPVGRLPSCRYQNGYSGANDCSATPDSGIQSIAGSPPSSGPFTPPMPSPAPYITLAACSVNDVSNRPSTSAEDFSDMPRLIPFHQMEEACSPLTEEASRVEEDVSKANVRCREQSASAQTVDDVPKIAITPAMNVNELVEQIISHMDPEQRKQFATVIKSKVETSDVGSEPGPETSKCSEAAVMEEQQKETLSEGVTAKVTRKSVARKRNQVGSSVERCQRSQPSTSARGGSRKDGIDKRLYRSGEEMQKRKRHLRDGADQVKRGGTVVKSEQEERTNSKKTFKESTMKRNEEVFIDCEANVEERGRESDEKERELQKDVEQETLMEEERRAQEETRERLKRKEEEEAQKRERLKQLGEGDTRERLKRKEEEAERLKRREEEEAKERLRVYRVGVKRKLNEQLKSVIEKVEKQLTNIELSLGPRMHWNMPWYRLNWKDVAERLVERDLLEKLAKEKNAVPKKTVARKKLKKVTVSKNDNSSPGQSVADKDRFAAKSYTKIKHNVIVDTYPRIEQLQCSCQKGSCGESDECLNRMVQMECTSSCSRGAHCSNKRIFRRECVDKLSLFETNNGRGFGVRTDVPIQKGQFVCEYVGEVVSTETFDARNERSYRAYRNHYALNLCPGFVIDAYRKGNMARFVNHSCAPNCEMQRWSVNGQHRIGLFALRSIDKGEELTYDYNWDSFDFYGVTPCSCGVPSCRGFLNKNVLMNAKEKELARNSGLLLLRNVRKSAKRKMDDALADRKTSKACSSYQQALHNFVDDMLSALDDREMFSRKQFKQMRKGVDEILCQPTASTSFASVLQSIETRLMELFDAYKKRQTDKRKVQSLRSRLDEIRDDHRERLRKSGALPEHFDEQIKHKPKGTSHRIITATTDLSYLDSEVAVGSYDVDCLTHVGAADTDSDCVRCICGISDDDGSMVQCDSCHFWLHEECVTVKHGSHEFECEICRMKATRTPAVDIVLRCQPQIKFKKCAYYRTLVNVHNIQVRINETVYLQKLANDDHKAELRRLNETSKSSEASGSQHLVLQPKVKPRALRFQPKTFARKDLRCFRVERLFASPEGHNFVFGFYYARPHEVYCEPGRMFHEKEHKAELRRLNETSKSSEASGSQHLVLQPKVKPRALRFQPKTFARKDLRCFRVERLFASPEGHNFVFGFYYARPHEVYCEPGRMFHEKEVFATPMFDTLPLDAVVGRCLVLEPRIYILGRPRMPRYDEADVYFCEYQTGKNSRYFEKIPSRNHYYINTEPHNFVRFPIQLSLSRTFTPFVMGRNADGGSGGFRQRTTSGVSKRILEQKRARLESIIASLPSSNEHYSPPRKIARHSSH